MSRGVVGGRTNFFCLRKASLPQGRGSDLDAKSRDTMSPPFGAALLLLYLELGDDAKLLGAYEREDDYWDVVLGAHQSGESQGGKRRGSPPPLM